MSQVMPTVYPVTNTLPPSNDSSNGSYGSVFIVLAVIIVISAFACFLGRLCNKRQSVATPPPPPQNIPRKDNPAKRDTNVIQTKDGDIEFGYDKRFASAKVATTSEPSPTMPNMVRPNSFHEHTTGRPVNSSGHESISTGRPANSVHETTIGQSNLFQKSNKVQPGSSPYEPSMGRPGSFRGGESEGDQARFGSDRDNQINFKFRTQPQRY